MHEMISQAIAKHQLPASFADTITMAYLPIAKAIAARCQGSHSALLVGVQGTQGSGKSTMADFLRLLLETENQLRVAVISIDDFYLTRQQRQQLAVDIHPLLSTRGVPGTHDLSLAFSTLEKLQSLSIGETCLLPCFNKALDDREDETLWPSVTGPIDVIIFEGWCLAIPPQTDEELQQPINDLEAMEDMDGRWRSYVNQCLQQQYGDLFAQLDCLVAITAPSFDCVYQWRQLQEQKLAASLRNAPDEQKSKLFTPQQLKRFIAHYQRLTEHGLKQLPASADWLIALDENHRVQQIEERQM